MTMEEIILSPFGALKVSHDGKKAGSIEFLWDSGAKEGRKPSGFALKLKKELEEYSKGKRKKFDVSYSPEPAGTDFQTKVWKMTAKIPYGRTLTYRDIAGMLGNPALARAVGNAMKANRLPFLIPCHRVVAVNGLGGYAGRNGVETKRELLKLEGAI